MVLTPEEKRRIYLEEKARREAQEKLQREKEEEKARLEARQRLILEREEEEQRKREEERRIYLEEKARLELMEQLQKKKLESRRKARKVLLFTFIFLSFIGIAVVIVFKFTGFFDYLFSPPSRIEVSSVPEVTKVTTGPRKVDSLEIRGRLIRVGDLADEVFQVLKPEDLITQNSVDNPAVPLGGIITKWYHLDGIRFAIVLRQREPGTPYIVTEIMVE